jgi:hypothetical protein
MVVLWCAAAPAQPRPGAPAGGGPALLHLPALEQPARQGLSRPVSIAIELPEDVDARAGRVIAYYWTWGDSTWRAMQLRAAGSRRYAGTLPARDVGDVAGPVRYFIHVRDRRERVIARGASAAAPYMIVLENDVPPLQPGDPGWPDPADVPPTEAAELVPSSDLACSTDADCAPGADCGLRKVCERRAEKRFRIVLSVQQDVGLLARTGVCAAASQQQEGTACYRADGSRYLGSPVLTNEPLGVASGPTRVVLGFEQLVSRSTSLGLRLGWALAGQGPTPPGGTGFVPLSAVARATYWLEHDPSAWLRPFAFVTGGFAMSDLQTSVHVREDVTAQPRQGGNDLEQDLTLWKRAGDATVGGGAGLLFSWSAGPGAGASGAFVELSVVDAFPFGAVIFSPSLGLQVAP